MKTTVLLLIHCFWAICLFPADAQTNDFEVVWRAHTNDWPSALWIYKAVPQVFAPPVISNLLAMTTFTMSENTCVPGQPMYEIDSNALYFTTVDEKRHLGISPIYGYIEYTDFDEAHAKSGQVTVGVPSEPEAYRLALDYLRKFGIDRSQLASKPSTNDFTGPNDLAIRRLVETQSWTDQKTDKEVTDIYKRGIYFVRQVDGVDIDGIVKGGVFIAFGANAKICELKITWRGLEPYQLLPTVTPAQIIEEIRLGHVKWRPYLPDFKEVKRITLTGFTPFYRGQPGDTVPEKQQHFVEPYVIVYASLDGSTNATLYGELPIFTNK